MPARFVTFLLKMGGRFVRDRHSGGGQGQGEAGTGSFPVILLGLSCHQLVVVLMENLCFFDFALFGSPTVVAWLRVMNSCDGTQKWALETLTRLLLPNRLWRASVRTA